MFPRVMLGCMSGQGGRGRQIWLTLTELAGQSPEEGRGKPIVRDSQPPSGCRDNQKPDMDLDHRCRPGTIRISSQWLLNFQPNQRRWRIPNATILFNIYLKVYWFPPSRGLGLPQGSLGGRRRRSDYTIQPFNACIIQNAIKPLHICWGVQLIDGCSFELCGAMHTFSGVTWHIPKK